MLFYSHNYYEFDGCVDDRDCFMDEYPLDDVFDDGSDNQEQQIKMDGFYQYGGDDLYDSLNGDGTSHLIVECVLQQRFFIIISS